MDWSQWWEAKFLLKFLATMSTAWVLTCFSSLQCHAMGIPPRSFMLSYSLSCYILPQGVALWIPFTLKTFFLICCHRKYAVFLVVSVIHSLLSVGINLAGGYRDKMELYSRDMRWVTSDTLQYPNCWQNKTISDTDNSFQVSEFGKTVIFLLVCFFINQS